MDHETKSETLDNFQRNRFGMFIHWGLYAMGARHEWLKRNENSPEEVYDRYFRYFDPDLYDPALWARMAREAGMKYVVLTTKHHEGFCLWDSAYTEYKAPNTPAGRDLLRPFVDAVRAEGLRVGFYYSLIDWHHPHFTIDRLHPRHPGTQDPADFAKLNEGRDMVVYAEYMRNQVRELLTEFGEIDLLWFDFSYPEDWEVDLSKKLGPGPGKGSDDWESEKLLALVRELQPQCLVNNRLNLPGDPDFTTPEQVQPEKPLTNEAGEPIPWEACQTFSGSWGYHRDEKSWKPLRTLLWMLIDGVSKGGNLLLNVGPTARGEFDYRAVERLDGIGEWMHANGRSIYQCGPAPGEIPAAPDVRYTWNPETRRLYAHLFAWPLKILLLPGLAGKVEYAQLLNDGSELLFAEGEKDLRITLPSEPPPVEIPVVELFLKP